MPSIDTSTEAKKIIGKGSLTPIAPGYYAYKTEDSLANILTAGYFSGFKTEASYTAQVQCGSGDYTVNVTDGTGSVVDSSPTIHEGVNITSELKRLTTEGGGVLDLKNLSVVKLDPDSVEIPEDIHIKIVSAVGTKIESTGDGDFLINLQEAGSLHCDNIYITDDGFDCGGITGESLSDANKPISLWFTNGEVDCSSGNGDAIRVRGFKKSFYIMHNTIRGNDSPDLDDEVYYLQTLCAIPDSGVPAGDKQDIVVAFNTFFGGATQFSNFGTSGPPSPLHLVSNNFFDASISAIQCYHGEEAEVSGNVVQGVKGLKPTGVEINNAGGAVWLDLYGAAVDGDRRGHNYSNNIIRGCKGVGLFIEEMFGHLTGWTILDTDIYPNGYTYTNADGYAFEGGAGLLVTGGTKYVTITIRSENNVHGVVVDRSLGVDPALKIGTIEFVNSHVNSNKKEGYLLRNEVLHAKVKGGTCLENGKESANTYDAIHITRDASQSVPRLTVDDVVFDDNLHSINHRHCIGKTYPGMRLNLRNCVLNSLSEWVNSGGTVTGLIGYNECLDSKGFDLSGVERWFIDNDGFRSEYTGKTTMDSNNGIIEYYYPTLDAGTAARAHATPNTAACSQVAAVMLTDRVQLFCRDSTGNLIDGTVTPIDVTVSVFSGKSRAS